MGLVTMESETRGITEDFKNSGSEQPGNEALDILSFSMSCNCIANTEGGWPLVGSPRKTESNFLPLMVLKKRTSC
jgi:hypothetical protein